MRSLFLLLASVFIFSCKGDDVVVPQATDVTRPKSEFPTIANTGIPELHSINFEEDTITYLALGDSYTIGSGVEELERWPNQFASSLRNLSILVEKPKIIARSGWTTANLIQHLQSTDLKKNYDMVSLLIGVNNQYQGVLFSTFQAEFIELLKFSLQKAKSRSSVFVLSIPDYGVTPFGGGQAHITEEINMYNSWISDVCRTNHIKFYNITDISRKAENDLSLLAKDQLHPSGIMYHEWVNMINDDLPKMLLQ